jgi:hypothetical protein
LDFLKNNFEGVFALVKRLTHAKNDSISDLHRQIEIRRYKHLSQCYRLFFRSFAFSPTA